MGMCASRRKESFAREKDPKLFIQKMKVLPQEIDDIIKQREEEGKAYERGLMLFAFKEAEWKKERKKLREEVKRLRRHVEEREERIRLMEEEMIIGKVEQFEEKSSVGSNVATATGTSGTTSLSLMDQMREESARRDETVEKWKMLYLAIKNELDDLIHKTHQGTLYWRADDDITVGLQRELKAKDEIIEVLKARVILMENEEYSRKREVDILRQSLKIMSNNNGETPLKHAKNRSKPSIRLTKSITKLTLLN